MIQYTPLQLYFFRALSPSQEVEIRDFGLGYSKEELEVNVKSKIHPDVIVEILGEISLPEILECIDKDNLQAYLPEKLKKKQFLYNLMYTKDFLLKDNDEKSKLQLILEKI